MTSKYEVLDKTDDKMIPISHRNRASINYRAYRIALTKCRSYCSTFAVVVCVVLLILSVLAVAFRPIQRLVNVVLIDSQLPVQHVTDAKYLSVAIDSSVIADGFRNINISDPKLAKMLSALAPGYLRIGGTMADRLYFIRDSQPSFKIHYVSEIDGGVCSYESVNCNYLLRPNFTMSGEEWLKLNRLAQTSGFTILFDLNCLIRNDDGSWNYSNADELVRFSDEHELDVIWELGNEPNAFRHVFNYEVNATQMAKDFKSLREMLNKYPRYKKSLLVGPDTTRPLPRHQESEKYLQTFLQSAGEVVDAVTWHQYYFNGRKANAMDFVNPDIFDLLQSQIVTELDIIKSTAGDKPVWLGETSSAYGGGAPGYSNRFLGSFIWLDKLGLAASNRIDLVIRQSLIKGSYALIDDNLNPSPDFWVSVLYKTFVGPEVVPCYTARSKRVRLYCQCSNKLAVYDSGSSLTVFGMNLKETDAYVRLESIVPNDGQNFQKTVLAYVLTTEYTLLSRLVMLNGEVLVLGSDGSLPPFKPKAVASEPYLVIPAYSMVFWIVPSNVKYCEKS